MLSFFSSYSVFGISFPLLSVMLRLRTLRVSICWKFGLSDSVFVRWLLMEGRGIWVESCGLRVSGVGMLSVWANKFMLRNESKVQRKIAFLLEKRARTNFKNELYFLCCTKCLCWQIYSL